MFRSQTGLSCCEPVVDGGIVMAADTEGALGEHPAVFQVGLRPFRVEYLEQHGILGLARDDDDILEVLAAGTDQRDAADVDLLDDFLGTRRPPSARTDKGLQ